MLLEMESDTYSSKVPSPLFPAFSSSSNNMQSAPLFPAFSSSNNNVPPNPLFPAYCSETNNTEEGKVDEEWLCNSSYAPSNTEIVYRIPEEIILDEEPVKEEKKKIKLSKKNKKVKSKKQCVPHPSAHDVPESESIRSYLNKKTFIEETGLALERAYRVDSKRDPENIHFEHLEQKNIAKYKLYPRIPVGLTSVQQALWPKSTVSNNKSIFSRYFSKKAMKLLKNISSVEKIDSKGSVSSDSTLKFIPLSQDTKNLNTIQDYSKQSCDGISTSWKLLSFQKVHVKENKIEESEIDTEVREKTKSFNKKLSECPQDTKLWLDFIDFQDELYLSKKGELYHTESSLVEKKIAILDKALTSNPKSVKLNVLKLNLCRSVWTFDKLIQRWEELVFLYPNNIEVWQEYFIFILTNVTYFTSTKILKLYSKCLAMLSNLSEGIIQSHEAPPNVIPKMLDIFSQMCFVLKSCGYTERAIGSFQALIELNLFREKAIEVLPVNDQISFLEPFWDSGALRFGEDGAIGWATTVSERNVKFNKIVTQSDLNNIEDEILDKKLPQWETWFEFEEQRELHHWMPWRPNPEYDQTDDDIDDADRNISFEDVSKFLFRIASEEHKFLLILHFLKFLGFNPHNFGCSISRQSNRSTYIDIEHFDIISNILKDTFFKKEESSPLYFETEIWTKDRIDFVNNVFCQARDKFSPKFRTILFLMQLKFQQKYANQCSDFNIKIDDVKNFTKSILKESENRNCLLLWFEYIKLESLHSKIKARKTFETLVSSSSAAIAEGKMSTTDLWYFIRSYLDLCFGIQDYSFTNTNVFSRDEIISLLVCIGCKEKYTPLSTDFIKPIFVLKALSSIKNFLQKELQNNVSESFETCSCVDPCFYAVLDCAKCFAYLQYFIQGIDAARNTFKDMSELIEINLQDSQRRYMIEQLNILQAEMINFHTWNSNDSLKPLQRFLQDSVSKYPNNPKLLYYLIKLKSASSVVSPTRRFFAKILRESNKLEPTIWIFALAAELSIMSSIIDQQRIDTDQDHSFVDQSFCQGINWKIRSIYERALELPACSYIPLLWRSYIQFEISNDELEKAKSIYHRAMQNCSWSKDLIMDGIQYFHDNLKQVIEFMIEKQMRIHTPLEEITLLMEHCAQEEMQ